MAVDQVNRMYPQGGRVFNAKLSEDFIKTAKAMGECKLRVQLDGQRDKADDAFGLVEIPVPFMIFPLLKGDKVKVYSPPESPDSMVLYSVDYAVPDAMFTQVDLPGGDLVTSLAKEDSLSFQVLSKDLAIITTKNYVIFRGVDVISLYTAGVMYQYVPSNGSYAILTGEYALEAKNGYYLRTTGDHKIVSQGQYSLKSTGSFAMESNAMQLKELVTQAYTYINDLYTTLASAEGLPVAGMGAPLGPVFGGTCSVKATEASIFKSAKVDVFFQE